LHVALVVNLHRPDAIDAAREAARWLFEHGGATVVAEDSVAKQLGVGSALTEEIAHSDLVIAFGGDGTIIRAAHICSEVGTPILGVHFGRFGFVTQCTPDEIGSALSAFVDGEHSLEKRMMLQTDLIRGEKTVATIHTLNESVLQRIVTDRMLTFEVTVNGHHLTSYPADGVMVSTPTGSTGYSLSVGGPVVDPTVEALILVALAPHTLSARPLVLGSDSVIKLTLETGGDAVLSGDGQTRLHLLPKDYVEIRRSDRTTNLVTIQNEDFLLKLRDRLFWSQSILGKDIES
jgi:NAD+ kinase